MVAANWKMELSYRASLEVAGALKKMLPAGEAGVDLVICPSFPALPQVAEILDKTKAEIGAQNIHWEEKGAWTGEVSVMQIREHAAWCLVGHSERRQLTGETDEQVQLKAALLLKHGLKPIVCVGETDEERQSERTVARITEQVNAVLSGLNRTALARLTIAYEPVWAIGTGETPDPDEAAETMLLVRKLAAERFDSDAAERLRVLYGGSVTAENVRPFVSEPAVDGVLVGGASLRPLELLKIMKVVEEEAI